MTTIIFAHPWHGSFNKAILDRVIEQLNLKDQNYKLIDLHKDNFDPVLREEDLKLYSQGKSSDQLVLNYQSILKETKKLVFIFPIWWFDVPAILKGFIDKVMLKNFAYSESASGLKGKLSNITNTIVITTSESPTWYLKFFAGNPIENNLIKNTLRAIGLKNIQWLNSSQTKSGSDRQRARFLKQIGNHFNDYIT